MASTRSLQEKFLAGDSIKYQIHKKSFKNKIVRRIQNDQIQIHPFFREFLYQTAKFFEWIIYFNFEIIEVS